ncbi:DNA-binding response regulator [Streptomyces pluripotens]|uniref:DNA-binding response regulator n=1 Tax=Streptomyces pluripotens TaxID=1355015 RepID=A0A221P4C9_9ACTN|nr:DNA-binding response regulator [Streptomyces pluripotens]ASN27109.1 DNA-binding response regulator [Streptomyces pluripotens]KIE23683.1 LuxR family transcriptional regulator [Streptomyces sp. MUSC 125]MCH0559853.1 response regulator transcription factor [Streptomyces sp. MUM 16J]
MKHARTDSVAVLIAGDRPVYRSSLRSLLDGVDALEVVGDVDTGPDAVNAIHRLCPDVVLLHVAPSSAATVEVITSLAECCPDAAVLIVSIAHDREAFLAAMRAGVRGYLSRGAPSQDLALAIRIVQSGGLVFDSSTSGWVTDHLAQPAGVVKPFPELTDRELEVLELVADGLGTAAIAHQLGLSIKTVRNYLSRIFAKLHLGDRAEAAVRARQAGLGH